MKEENKDSIYWVIKLKELEFYDDHAIRIVKGINLTDSKFESIKRLKEASTTPLWACDVLNYEEAGLL